MAHHRPITILALASDFKGTPFLEECKRQGCHVILLVSKPYANAAWPWACIDEHFDMPDVRKQPDVTHAVSWLARTRRIDRVVALDDYDVETAAALREHLRLRGMGDSLARHFRDKLAMRTAARDAGIPVPRFTAAFNNDEVAEFLASVPPPWMLKPRLLAGSEGIRRLHEASEVWRALESLGDRRSFHLLEQFIPGDVYHVDALTWKGEVVFELASRYGTPPMTALQGRGIFSTRTLERQSPEAHALLGENRRILEALGYRLGVTHTELIRGRDDGTWYFLETAARVGGGSIDKLIQAATGVVMWQEVARMELADAAGQSYELPGIRDHQAGLMGCPYPQGRGDLATYLATYADPEVQHRGRVGEHCVLVVGSPDHGRIEELLARYAARLTRDLLS